MIVNFMSQMLDNFLSVAIFDKQPQNSSNLFSAFFTVPLKKTIASERKICYNYGVRVCPHASAAACLSLSALRLGKIYTYLPTHGTERKSKYENSCHQCRKQLAQVSAF
jgi:hypothetical protein